MPNSNLLTRPNATQKIANYLKSFLNDQFEKEVQSSAGSIKDDTIVVRSVRNYDDFNVPLIDFPLLKVYKNQDRYNKGGVFRQSTGAITYAISYPQLEILPNLLDWVSYQINLGLLNYETGPQELLPPSNSEGYTAEYLLSLNEQTQVVYPFLRFNISFKNFCDNATYVK